MQSVLNMSDRSIQHKYMYYIICYKPAFQLTFQIQAFHTSSPQRTLNILVLHSLLKVRVIYCVIMYFCQYFVYFYVFIDVFVEMSRPKPSILLGVITLKTNWICKGYQTDSFSRNSMLQRLGFFKERMTSINLLSKTYQRKKTFKLGTFIG